MRISIPFLQPLAGLAGFIAIILLVLAIQFYPLFKGLSPTGADVIGSIGKLHQIKEFEKETGEKALWNPYVFSGMPIYHRTGSQHIDIYSFLNLLYDYTTNGRRVFIYYFILNP